VLEYALGGRLDEADRRLKALRRWYRRTGNPLAAVRPSYADVQYEASKDVVERALWHDVDWVLVVCGAFFHPNAAILCRRAKLPLAVVFTESPYDDAKQVKVAPLFDVCFTNERGSVERLRRANPNTHYLPMGYDPAQHGPHLNGTAPAHDVVFVGTGFADRTELLAGVDWTGIDFGLYGTWGHVDPGHPLAPYVRDGLVDNAQAGALYRKAKIGLNLYRDPEGAPAESLNPRAYELAADGVFTLSHDRAEVREKFGAGVRTFRTPAFLEATVRSWLWDDAGRQAAARGLPLRVQDDTYHHRAAQLVAHLS
jgi:spore maturation protein CgeB